MLWPITLSIVLLLAWTVARCALQANNRRLSSYKRRAKLLLAFSSVWISIGTFGSRVDGRLQLRLFVGDRGGSDQFNSPVAGTPIRRCNWSLCCYVWSWYIGTPFVGVPICCVERWNLIRRLAGCRSPVAGTPICCVERWNPDTRLAGRRSPVAGRRYTNLLCWTLESDTATRRSPGRRSPVHQSVVLNVGIWYGDSPVAGCRSPVHQSVVLNVGIWYGDSPVAGTPICCVERWNLIRRLAGRRSPVAGRRVLQFCSVETLEAVTFAGAPLRRRLHLLLWNRWRFGVRNQEVADELNKCVRSLHWVHNELTLELLINSCSL